MDISVVVCLSLSEKMNEEKCPVCKRSSPPSRGRPKKKSVNWIFCDLCSSCFHASCVRISDEQMEKAADFQFLCEKCCVRGCLVPKVSVSTAACDDVDALKKTVQELAAQVAKLQEELVAVKASSKKQLDQLKSKLHNVDRSSSHVAVQDRLTSNIEGKLEIIEKGAKMANTCLQSVNSSRLAINKIPLQEGENVRTVVEGVLHLLGCQNELVHVTSCFRLPVKPSKWTDRTISPTIVVVFDTGEARQAVLRRYYDQHSEAKLCNLNNGPDIDYRFTMNEMLSANSFRLRNYALRLKQNKLVKSVFIRNDKVSVLLPGQKRYVPITTIDELQQLATNVSDVPDSSSVFFDCTANVSTSSQC